MKRLLPLVLLFVSALPCAATESAVAPDEGCYRIGVLFDPDVPAAGAAPDLERLRAYAERGGSQAAYLLGTLYRLGPAHPAARVERDPVQARTWLRQAALDGHMMALAGLAETELAAGEPMQAMVLAQALIHFSRRLPDAPAPTAKYQAGLVARAFEALGQDPGAPDEKILVNFKAFVAEHGASIEEGAVRRGKRARDADRGPTCHVAYDEKQWPLVHKGQPYQMGGPGLAKLEAPGYALFHIEVKPNGRVGRALVVDSLPGPDAAVALRRTVEDLRYNKLRGAPPRTALAPVSG